MKKFLLIIVLLVALLAGAVTWFTIHRLDGVARTLIEDTGTQLLGTRLSIDQLHISLAEGKVELTGMQLANPPGYSEAPAIAFGLITVAIKLESLNQPVLEIAEVLIHDPQVRYELLADGTANMDVLLANIEQADSGSDAATPLIIDRLQIKGGQITAHSPQRSERELVFDFPETALTGLGAPDGATPEQIGSLVAEHLLERIVRAAGRAGARSLVEEQKEKLLQRGNEKLKEKLDERLKGLLDRDG